VTTTRISTIGTKYSICVQIECEWPSVKLEAREAERHRLPRVTIPISHGPSTEPEEAEPLSRVRSSQEVVKGPRPVRTSGHVREVPCGVTCFLQILRGV